MLSTSIDIEELHSRQYLIYDTEAEAVEAIRELHENQYLILDEETLQAIKEEYSKSFSEIADSISLVPPSVDTVPFKKKVSVIKAETPDTIVKKEQPTKESGTENMDDKDFVRTLYIDKYLENGRSCHAAVNYNVKTKEVIIKKGSIFALLPTTCFLWTPTGVARNSFVEKYCEKKSKGYVLKEDTPCKSLSTAACYVIGRSANAMIEWRDEMGTPICKLSYFLHAEDN